MWSATKPIVASAVWVLIGDGLLEIERPVAHYIPEFATNGKQAITVEQVLLHTAGFPNAPMDPVEGADTVTRVKRFTEWELEWEPGSRFEYHALAAHWVLAELLERLSGEGADFRDVIETRICEPLGLPRLLGIPEEEQGDIVEGVRLGEAAATSPTDIDTMQFNKPAVRAAGVPGGGGHMTAATMERFYQALLHNPDGLWDADVLADAKTNIRCRYPDPLMNVAVNRSIGLVLAGDDGLHQFRYAMFGGDRHRRSRSARGRLLPGGLGRPTRRARRSRSEERPATNGHDGRRGQRAKPISDPRGCSSPTEDLCRGVHRSPTGSTSSSRSSPSPTAATSSRHVSRAGGFGVWASSAFTPEELEVELNWIDG